MAILPGKLMNFGPRRNFPIPEPQIKAGTELEVLLQKYAGVGEY